MSRAEVLRVEVGRKTRSLATGELIGLCGGGDDIEMTSTDNGGIGGSGLTGEELIAIVVVDCAVLTVAVE